MLLLVDATRIHFSMIFQKFHSNFNIRGNLDIYASIWSSMDVDVDANAAIDYTLSYGSFGSTFPNTL